MKRHKSQACYNKLGLCWGRVFSKSKAASVRGLETGTKLEAQGSLPTWVLVYIFILPFMRTKKGEGVWVILKQPRCPSETSALWNVAK